MTTTYGYHYGGKINRGERYEKVAFKVPTSKANLGEGHSAKSLERQLADAGVKTEQRIPWYKDARGRQLHAQEAVKNKNFDDFKEFSDEQIHQMYPDDAQLANYIINGKNGTFMRDVKSLNEDAIAYEKKYGKVSDADVDSIIDAAIQKRDKKSLEDMGILTNDAIERWIDRHPSNSGFGKTGNVLKSWRDEPAKYVIEPEATDTNNASKPVEINTNQPAANPEKQAAQDMVNNSKPNLLDLSFNEKIYRPWAEEYGERARPNDMDWIPDPTEFWATRDNYPNPQPLVKYNPFLAALRSNGKLTSLGYAGLTGLALLAPYLKQNSTNEQSQTQVPYRMEPEPEPVNEAVSQSELTPEQQFVLQSTSPFDYAKGINLFDLYDRYGSPDSPIRIDPVKDKELIDEAMSDFVSPQEPPALGTKIQNSSLTSPEADEVPEELNDAMRSAKPGSFWKATGGAIAPKVNAVKNAAQNIFGRTLARSKAAPKASNEAISNIRDTANSPIVLNDPNHRKTRDVQNNSVTPEQAAASQMVNQYAGIPVEVIRAKNQPFLTTDAIWNRLRQKGLVSPEEGIRSGLFTPDEVRYITENDLWRYR